MLLKSPAIVLNPGTAGVGIIHALSLADVDIVTVGRKWPPLLGRFSRFPKRHVFYDVRQGESLATCLLQLAAELDGRGVLFPAIDVDLEEIVLHQEALAARYHVPAASHIGAKIFDKSWQYALADRTDVPTPRHVVFNGGDSPDVRELRFPLIVKPSTRTAASGGRAFRLRILRDAAELDRALAELAREHGGRSFQLAEDIPGEPDQLYTIGSYSNRDGRVLRSYSGRKLSQHPYTHGDASVAESIRVPEVVVSHARRLLEAARFHGISQVEFKYDQRDGLYKLLEINGRSWSWIKLPALSGVNLPLIQYYDLTGDQRLTAALAVPQDDGKFFVRDQLVRLNDLSVERQRIEEIGRRKTLVPAVFHDGELRLKLAYHLATTLMRLRGGTSPI